MTLIGQPVHRDVAERSRTAGRTGPAAFGDAGPAGPAHHQARTTPRRSATLGAAVTRRTPTERIDRTWRGNPPDRGTAQAGQDRAPGARGTGKRAGRAR